MCNKSQIVSCFTKKYNDFLSNLPAGPSLQAVPDLQNAREFTLTASMSGGRGEVAWQHTQLFRQSSDDKSSIPFEVKVTFK